MSVRKIQGYGWRPQMPDHRDRVFNQENKILSAHQVPGRWDLHASMPPIWDQMQAGTCVPHGGKRVAVVAANKAGITDYDPSRLYTYAKGREMEGVTDLSQDTGMEVRDIIKVYAKFGSPPESEWPYSDQNPGPLSEEPPSTLDADAVKNEALVYKAIVIGGPGAPMRTAIFQGYPIAFGFPVPEYFEDGWNASTDALPLPTADTGYIGGHCVVVTGYDFTREQYPEPVFICDNSWGTSWGMAGRFAIDYRWFSGDQLATDLWIIEKMS